jgi:ATP-dependent phosphofructokinase / diphosphate-dependent phosphofructokinase
MPSESKTNCIGILTSGGDCPGLNAAIRAVTKAAINEYDMTVIGIMDGFRGLVENRTVHLEVKQVSGILTSGGTILGTSRDKVHKMPMGGKVRDMTEVAVENVRRNHIDCLVCLGGGGTQKNALRLHQAGGIDVMTLPKTIDNDVEGTEVTFGFDTALQIATDAIDRLHTTATSHHRVIVCEIMGHKTGWLTLCAGIAGGADIILIPEMPYDLNVVADYLLERRRRGSRFSIIAVAEGAISVEDANAQASEEQSGKSSKKKKKVKSTTDLTSAAGDTDDYHLVREPISSRIARRLQEMTGIEARVTALGHVQRGGVPTAFDRWLCTRLGTKAAQLLAQGVYNVMVGYDCGLCKPIPLERVAGKRRTVPKDHPMIISARLVGTCMGERSPFSQGRTTTA